MKLVYVFILSAFFCSTSFTVKISTEDLFLKENTKSVAPQFEENINFRIKIDEITKSKEIEQKHTLILIQKGLSLGSCWLSAKNDTIYCNFKINYKNIERLCINTDSKIRLKLKNEDTVTLRHSLERNCDRTVTYNTVLSTQDLKALSESEVEQISYEVEQISHNITAKILDFEILDNLRNNSINKEFFPFYIGKNPKQVFMELINEIQNL